MYSAVTRGIEVTVEPFIWKSNPSRKKTVMYGVIASRS